MNYKDQAKFFKAVRKRFKDWTAKWASGYVHGVMQGLKKDGPARAYRNGFKHDEYATGYIYGFIDAYGSDAFTADWCKQLGLSETSLLYRWWEDETQATSRD